MDPPEGTVVLVDAMAPYHGKLAAARAQELGNVHVLELASSYMRRVLEQRAGGREMPEHLRLPSASEAAVWAAAQDLPPIVAVFCDSDAGLEDAEAFAAAVAPCSEYVSLNGVNAARRDKYLMHEALREAGLACCRQKLCRSPEEAVRFAASLGEGHRCVVKPRRGCGSDQVYLCDSEEAVRAAHGSVSGAIAHGRIGEKNEDSLVQEYLDGEELVVDTVSSGGEHRVVAVWRYDKRRVNGRDFVYFATKLCGAPRGSDARAAAEYVLRALDAIGYRQGPAHSEVRMTARGPVLLEVNCRWHDTDFSALCQECVGYEAHTLSADAYLAPERVAALPAVAELRRDGRIVHLVCYQEGEVVDINHLEEIAAMESVRRVKVHEEFHPGETISPTIDIRTDAGFVMMAHEDPGVVDADYERILELQKSLFRVRQQSM